MDNNTTEEEDNNSFLLANKLTLKLSNALDEFVATPAMRNINGASVLSVILSSVVELSASTLARAAFISNRPKESLDAYIRHFIDLLKPAALEYGTSFTNTEPLPDALAHLVKPGPNDSIN